MQTYPVRPTHRSNLTVESLGELARQNFGDAKADGPAVETSYGALVKLRASAAGKELGVEVTMNPKVSDELARETIRRYNAFLEAVTGYSAKERAKRARKSSGHE